MSQFAAALSACCTIFSQVLQYQHYRPLAAQRDRAGFRQLCLGVTQVVCYSCLKLFGSVTLKKRRLTWNEIWQRRETETSPTATACNISLNESHSESCVKFLNLSQKLTDRRWLLLWWWDQLTCPSHRSLFEVVLMWNQMIHHFRHLHQALVEIHVKIKVQEHQH